MRVGRALAAHSSRRPAHGDTYAVTAKIVVYQDDLDSDLYKVTCQLRARPEWQEVRVDESEIGPSSNGRNPVTLPLQGVVTLHEQRAGNVMLFCRDYDFGDAKGRMLQMMAISVS